MTALDNHLESPTKDRQIATLRESLARAEDEKNAAVKVAEDGERYRSFLIEIARHLDLLGTNIKDLPAAVADRLPRRPWPVMECPDCDRAGTTGTAPGGKKYFCETCGGDEDSDGRGWVRVTDMDTLASRLEQARDIVGELLNLQYRDDLHVKQRAEAFRVAG